MISLVPTASALSRTISARQTCLCGACVAIPREHLQTAVPYLWNEDEDKISFAVICEDKPGLLLEVHYPDGVVPGSLEASLLLKLADEFPPVKFWFTQGDHIPNGRYARRAFIPIEIANFNYADKIYKRFKF